MKRLLCTLLAAAMLFSLCACGKTASNTDESSDVAETHIVVDHSGNEVAVPNEINRIVVCDIYPMPSVLSVFFDSADKIVGMAGPSMLAAQNSLLSELYPEILNAKTEFIDGTEINMEELVKLEPDIIFYSSSRPDEGEMFAKAGIPAIAISANKWEFNAIETLNNWISLLSEIFPANAKADVVKDYSDRVYNMVQERVAKIPDNERAKAFFLFQYSDTTLLTSGKLFFGQWWADAIGAVNVAEELASENSVAVNMEQVYAWNPDLIFITNFTPATPDTLYNNSIGNYDWSGVDAVINRNVHKMPLGMYRSYTAGIDTPITLMWLAKAAYPQFFEDIDIIAETKDYYKEVFGIDLSDEQAESIFAPSSEAGRLS